MALSDTVAELEANFTTMQATITSVSTELAALHTEVVNLQAQVAAGGVDAATLQRIQVVADGLKTQSDALSAAGTANAP